MQRRSLTWNLVVSSFSLLWAFAAVAQVQPVAPQLGDGVISFRLAEGETADVTVAVNHVPVGKVPTQVRLPPGSYDIAAKAADGREWHEAITVLAGEERTLRIGFAAPTKTQQGGPPSVPPTEVGVATKPETGATVVIEDPGVECAENVGCKDGFNCVDHRCVQKCMRRAECVLKDAACYQGLCMTASEIRQRVKVQATQPTPTPEVVPHAPVPSLAPFQAPQPDFTRMRLLNEQLNGLKQEREDISLGWPVAGIILGPLIVGAALLFWPCSDASCTNDLVLALLGGSIFVIGVISLITKINHRSELSEAIERKEAELRAVERSQALPLPSSPLRGRVTIALPVSFHF